MTAIRVAATIALLAHLTLAQEHVTAHPQETLTGTSGNYATFGVYQSFGIESRVQFLVPAHELPNAGAMLSGMELLAFIAGTIQYESLEIRASATNATSLGLDLDANVTAPETLVLSFSGLPISYSTTSWTTLGFSNPYTHDGQSAILLDVRKKVDATLSTSVVSLKDTAIPPRNDRPRMVYSHGGIGSGASTAATATATAHPISFRLRWTDAPTMRNRSDSPTAGAAQYALSGSVVLTVDGSPGQAWVLAAGSGLLSPAPAIPGLQGHLRISDPQLVAGGLPDASGDGSFTLPIPPTPSLVGLYLTYQGAVLDSTAGAIVLTNATDHYINS